MSNMSDLLTGVIVCMVFVMCGVIVLAQHSKYLAVYQTEQQELVATAMQNNDVAREVEITEKFERAEVWGLIGSSTTYHYYFIVRGNDGVKTDLEVSKELYLNSDVGDRVILYKGYDEAKEGFKLLFLEIQKG